jgi:serine/threonine protein kinase
MESLQQQSVQEPQRPGINAAMRVNLWVYGGSQVKLHDFTWRGEGPVASLFGKVLGENAGKIIEGQQNRVLAYFDNPLQALSAAKSLQLSFLTLDQGPFAGRLLASVTIDRWVPQRASQPVGEDVPTQVVEARPLPREEAAPEVPRILVANDIRELAKGVAGFEFSATPRRNAGESGSSEAMYELLWADASTYTRLRQEIQDAGKNAPKPSRYLIDCELGRGAMGVVYKAHDKLIDRTVALKTILVDHNAPDRDELVERLQREAKAAGSLDHPNIITIYDVGQEGDLVYLSMQFIEGDTLAKLLVERKLPPLSILLSYIDQICSAVGFAHQRGVVHRDLKPSNLMLTSQGFIKVLDFGIAKLGDASMTQAGMVVGTPSYMAPEQAAGKGVDHRSDIFALGAVFYELFTGERAFGTQGITTVLYNVINEDPVPPSVIQPSLPSGIDTIIQKALAKDPQQRFQKCEEMREAFRQQATLLGAAGTQHSLPVEPEPPIGTQLRPTPLPSSIQIRNLLDDTTVTRRRAKRSPWTAIAVCVVLVAAIAGGWVFRGRLIAAFKGGAQPTQVKNDLPAGGAPATGSGAPVSAETGTTKPDDTTSKPSTDDSSHAASVPEKLPDKPAAATTNFQTVQSATNNSSHSAAETQTPAPPKSAVATPENGKTQNEANDSGRSKGRKRNSPNAVIEPPAENVQSADGFSSSDIPALLRKADADAGRGDYRSARYEYGIVLRLDRQNAAAREGMRRVQEAEKEKAQN